MKQVFSDEIINAYIDDQLDKTERAQILEALPLDNELATRLCKLQKVKDMVQLAYPAAPVPQITYKGSSNWARIAAGFLLVVGIVSGWIANGYFSSEPSLTELAQSIQIQNTMAEQDKWRLMLHVNSSDPAKFKTLLDETEQLLSTSAHSGKKVAIEILTNGPGLTLLRNGSGEHILRLKALTQKYDNLALLACEKAINKIQADKNIKFNLIPEAKVVKSALRQVIKRKEEGWSYIRI
jgi:intracellular sulfur oxidation DsrE/DsrF family protein